MTPQTPYRSENVNEIEDIERELRTAETLGFDGTAEMADRLENAQLDQLLSLHSCTSDAQELPVFDIDDDAQFNL